MEKRISRRAFTGLVGGAVILGAGCLEDEPKTLMIANSTDVEISVYISINDGDEDVVEEIIDLAPATDQGWIKYYRSPVVIPNQEYEVTIINLSEEKLNWERRSEKFQIPYEEAIYQIDILKNELTGVLSIP